MNAHNFKTSKSGLIWCAYDVSLKMSHRAAISEFLPALDGISWFCLPADTQGTDFMKASKVTLGDYERNPEIIAFGIPRACTEPLSDDEAFRLARAFARWDSDGPRVITYIRPDDAPYVSLPSFARVLQMTEPIHESFIEDLLCAISNRGGRA